MGHSTSRGHGGKGAKQQNPMDAGAVGNGTTEYKEVSWLNDQLIKGTGWADTSDYAATNVNDNLYLIVQNTNKVSKSSEITISNHLNAFNRSANGVEVWYYLGDAKGKALAEKMSAAIAKELGLVNRGAKPTTSLYVVNNTNATCLLIEWCFVDSAYDMERFRKGKEKAVDAVLKILGYNGISTGGSTPTPNPTPSKKPEGNWIAENKLVKVSSRDQKIYSNFNWKLRTLTNDVIGKEYKVTGKYNHENGSTYYSMYDNKGGWHGYINSKFVTEVKPPAPKPSGKPSHIGKWIAQNGKFTVGEATPNAVNVPVTSLPLTVNATGSGAKIADMAKGNVIAYDAFMNDGNYLWIRQPRSNGYGYMATGNVKNWDRSDYWGRFR
ncbi:N-acetylmuramoyl-L-alanine amidase [Vagococcus fluvialis]|uniref:N-acetylmuramoyl-L-alanine amidase n=1 Tax=Vagococcus fluvialis TaxID=2738 RepID=UPI001D0A0259|nr:N-acetylmuramoyl-L-alanine amidase [Vagococcus fluvialis]UDM72717.1 N-acetylmuramoyl-L-alanine amidase [Vagococcus fluvialis]UDM78439.1 N-acetylmuramoyl-L-alanine amidase [Vagococcus fluvialis]UDM83992.1 N-acetylmuramoyl-L-alanine amidase [Vagococcus fluvialis]